MNKQMLNCWFDGSCGPENPGGTAAYGFVVKDGEGNTLESTYGRVGSGKGMTNNVGEYAGILSAMKWIMKNFPEERVIFYGDSTLVIGQMNGEIKARKGAYLPLFLEAQAMATEFILKGLWTFEWIPREMNSEADNLAQYLRFKKGK